MPFWEIFRGLTGHYRHPSMLFYNMLLTAVIILLNIAIYIANNPTINKNNSQL